MRRPTSLSGSTVALAATGVVVALAVFGTAAFVGNGEIQPHPGTPIPIPTLAADTSRGQGEEPVEIVALPSATRDAGPNTATRSENPLPKGVEPPEDPGVPTSAQGREYTWEDGDRTRRVRLQSDLTVASDEESPSVGRIVKRTGDGNIVKGAGGSEGQPVFRSESGALMTLPGGVLVVLDSEWGPTTLHAFFQSNQIKMNRVSSLGALSNAYFIQTEPGFPSLHLANALARQDGVEVSSPNWWTEATTR